jgi:phage baseplate assembly protein W
MSRENGKQLEYMDHLRQSIIDILTTPIGTRVHRRDYGSILPRLVDRPVNTSLVQEVITGVADALEKWEPRVKLERIRLVSAEPGELTLQMTAIRLVDGTPIVFDGLVIR